VITCFFIYEIFSNPNKYYRADIKDKRAVLVSLTPKGKEIQTKKWHEIYQRFTNNLAKISAEDKLDLAYALHKVNVLLKKMED